MFQALKRFFGKGRLAALVPLPRTPPAPAAPRPSRSAPPAIPAKPSAPASAPAPVAAPQEPTPKTTPIATADDMIRVSFKGVVAKLPETLRFRVKAPSTTQCAVPLARIVQQLQQGRVQIPWGEFRQYSPAGSTSGGTDQDSTLIDLPLPEILPQVRPDQLPRRADQKKVQVPDDVAPVFGPKASGVRVAPKDVPKAAPKPATPAVPVAAIQMTAADLHQLAPQRAAAKPAAPTPPAKAAAPAAHAPAAPLPKHGLPAPPGAMAPPAAVPAPPPAGTVNIPVSAVIGALPDAIRSALEKSKSRDAVFALPAADLEKGMKSGKVVFAWRVLRTALRPSVITSTTPAADELQIELPLAGVAPIFLAAHKPATPQRKLMVSADIPDVFAPGKAAGLAPAKAAPVVAPSARPPTPVPAVPAKRPAAPPAPAQVPVLATPPPAPVQALPPRDIGEIFGQPGRKNWTPAEIVQKTAQLPGVSGALIVLQDGLLVANQLPPALNAETIAAFLPQMYGRMTQYCKELKFGEPRKMTFVIETVPLKIYRATGTYFTVVGRADEPLPDAHLDVIAAQFGVPSK